MRRAAVIVAAALFAATGIAWSADLEPARDALRRHEYDRAVGLLQPPAQAGDAEAAFLLSQLLRYGRGAPKDLAGACKLLESSASAGFARAAGSLAAMLESRECQSSARTASEWREAAQGAGYSPPAASTEQSAEVVAPTAEQLLRAARAGDLPLVKRLLQPLGPDVTDEYGRTPLMLAIEAGQDAVARTLLESGASLAAADRNGETALLIAARKGNRELSSLMIAGGAPVNHANNSGTTALMLAAGAGARALCETLQAAGADPALRDRAGLTAGDHAARSGHAELAGQLGVRPSQSAAAAPGTGALHAGQTPVMIAAERGDLETLRRLLAAGGVEIDAGDAQGLTALAHAARSGRPAAVSALLDAGARVDVQDRAGWTALGHAVVAGQMEVVRLLLKAGANPRATQGHGRPLLLLAAESKRADAVPVLAHAGADPDQSSPEGLTPLMAAASANDMDSIRALIDSGAHADRTDKRGRTALWYAASRDAAVVIPALSTRSILNAADDEGTTPLAAAVGQGNRKAVDALLKGGADARSTTRNGNSVLHLAAAGRQAVLIPVLIAARAPIDAVNSQGDTALMLAVKSRCPACVQSLLAAGASTRVRNKDGLSALDIARLTKDGALVKLLE
jgi:ankyrin repeat protein